MKALDSADVYADLTFPTPDVRLGEPCVAINMVSTLDGKISIAGKAGGIGSPVDRRVMRNIRSAADAILVGAGSLRSEEMSLGVSEGQAERRRRSGRHAQPLGVILAGSAGLPLHRKVFVSKPHEKDSRILVIAGGATPKSALDEAARLGVHIILTGCPGLPAPDQVLRMLYDRFSVRSLLVEGGPTVNASFLSAGKVTDLFLTLSPKISTGNDEAPSISAPLSASLPHEAAPPFGLSLGLTLSSVHCCPSESELYLKYSLGSGSR